MWLVDSEQSHIQVVWGCVHPPHFSCLFFHFWKIKRHVEFIWHVIVWLENFWNDLDLICLYYKKHGSSTRVWRLFISTVSLYSGQLYGHNLLHLHCIGIERYRCTEVFPIFCVSGTSEHVVLNCAGAHYLMLWSLWHDSQCGRGCSVTGCVCGGAAVLGHCSAFLFNFIARDDWCTFLQSLSASREPHHPPSLPLGLPLHSILCKFKMKLALCPLCSGHFISCSNLPPYFLCLCLHMAVGYLNEFYGEM